MQSSNGLTNGKAKAIAAAALLVLSLGIGNGAKVPPTDTSNAVNVAAVTI